LTNCIINVNLLKKPDLFLRSSTWF